jgi:hypothetical protein
MVIGRPFVEVIRNVEGGRVWCGILEINDDDLQERGRERF